MDSQKASNATFCHSGLDPESSSIKMFWTSAFAVVIAAVTFCERVNNGLFSLYSTLPPFSVA
jgi:hypothetical protein